jgi:hypothetical protein
MKGEPEGRLRAEKAATFRADIQGRHSGPTFRADIQGSSRSNSVRMAR